MQPRFLRVENLLAMRYQYVRVLFWAMVIYAVFLELKTLMVKGVGAFVADWTGFQDIILSLSSITIFSLFSLGSYSGLFLSRGRALGLRLSLVAGSVILVMAIRYVLEEVLFLQLFGFDNYYEGVTSLRYFWDNFYYALVFSSVGIVYFFIQNAQYEEQLSQELTLQNKRTELAFLRSQMNPHFLFNTLNNIYTLVYQQSSDALPAMDKLTSLLRYALYEQNELVPVSRELKYIDDFIALQGMRYDYPIQINLRVSPEVLKLGIPPFLLIAFVENAFKHGDLRNPNSPITVSLGTQTDQFVFTCVNQKRRQEKDMLGGIGLDNVRKRLALLYGEYHTLNIEEDDKQFSVQLGISLTHCKVLAANKSLEKPAT
jgi:two-component system LytT family sensor kinase